jgi:hypothetical protein
MNRPLPALLVGIALHVGLLPTLMGTAGAAPGPGPGDLDAGFGPGGTVTTDFSGSNGVAHAVAIQSDGKIVAAGSSQQINPFALPDFALARYLAQ